MRYRYAFLVLAIVLLATHARAQDGHIRHGHDQWHAGFYSKLQRPGNKGSCCNLSDCRPTSTRTLNEAYEIKKDGRWISLPLDKVLRITAPDGGAHICAPDTNSRHYAPDEVFCVVMPPEG
jgi:hypothetical protein